MESVIQVLQRVVTLTDFSHAEAVSFDSYTQVDVRIKIDGSSAWFSAPTIDGKIDAEYLSYTNLGEREGDLSGLLNKYFGESSAAAFDLVTGAVGDMIDSLAYDAVVFHEKVGLRGFAYIKHDEFSEVKLDVDIGGNSEKFTARVRDGALCDEFTSLEHQTNTGVMMLLRSFLCDKQAETAFTQIIKEVQRMTEEEEVAREPYEKLVLELQEIDELRTKSAKEEKPIYRCS